MIRRNILILFVLLAVAGGAVGIAWYLNRTPTSLALPGVVEIQEVRLSSKLGGRVDRVAVREGQLVKAGDPLVYLDAPETQAQLKQAQARLDAARADLDKARNGSRYEEIAQARAAAASSEAHWQRLKAGSRPEEIEQAQADLDAAEADFRGAQQDLQRATQLYPRGAMSKAEMDSVQSVYTRLQGRLGSARAHLKLLQAGSRAEDIAEAAADLEKAKANLDLLEHGSRPEDIASAEARVAELQGRVAELKVNLQEAVIVAPEPAVVEVLAVRKGDVVAPNQSVIRVLRAEDLWVKVYVPETELGRVRLRQTVDVTIDSYPDRRFEGTVDQIAGVSEFTPRNIQSADERKHQVFAVKVYVRDPQGVFKSGMAATVWLPLHD
jgi:HlyD family secretion protein